MEVRYGDETVGGMLEFNGVIDPETLPETLTFRGTPVGYAAREGEEIDRLTSERIMRVMREEIAYSRAALQNEINETIGEARNAVKNIIGVPPKREAPKKHISIFHRWMDQEKPNERQRTGGIDLDSDPGTDVRTQTGSGVPKEEEHRETEAESPTRPTFPFGGREIKKY